MKWPLAVILATGVLVGCRTTQPAANPFIRTTVPPPGTGQGAVVVQGEQYYPNGAPPVGSPPPVTTAPPIVAPPPPGMAPPPGGPPPVVIPPKDKYGPPGGSFQYNQSSNDGKPALLEAGAAATAVQLASATEPSGEPSTESAPEPTAQAAERWLTEERPAERSDAVNQAVLLAVEHDPLVGDEDRGREAHRPPPPIVSDARVEPPEPLAMADDEPRVSSDAMRILRGSNEVAAAIEEPEDGLGEQPELPAKPLTQPAARHLVQAAEEPPAPQDERAGDDAMGGDQLADAGEKTDQEGAVPEPSMASVSRPSNEAQAAPADYAFARDYGSLRGRLEYSQSSRQWKLRYIPIDGATDAFGGSVILPTSPAVESFKPGDLVAVRGSLAGKSPTSSGFSPRYELESIEPLAR